MEIFSIPDEYGSNDNFILCLDEIVDEDELLRRVKVEKGTYAGNIVKYIHNNIFVKSVDLSKE